MTMHIYSAEHNDELRAFISPFHVLYRHNSARRSVKHPLPPHFMDLPDVIELAQSQGVSGILEKAELKVWGEHGAVWRLTMKNRSGGSFSAVDGKRIKGDVTGYVDAYNESWASIAQQWQEMSRSKNSSGGGSSSLFDDDYEYGGEKWCYKGSRHRTDHIVR